MNSGEKPFKVFFYIFGKELAEQDADGKEKSLMGFQRKVAPFCEKYVSCGERNWVGTLQNLPPVYDVQNQHKQVKKSYKIPRESLEHIVSFVVDEYMIQEDAFLVELYQQ